jgi:hypothetical protein
MTSKDEELDQLIHDALDADDRELLDRYGEEPGYFAQAFAIFRGKLAWVMWLMYIVNILGAALAGWAIWKMFQTTDPVMTVRWAVLVLAAMNVGLFMKGGMGIQGQINRVLREMKRMELQLLRSQARDD